VLLIYAFIACHVASCVRGFLIECGDFNFLSSKNKILAVPEAKFKASKTSNAKR